MGAKTRCYSSCRVQSISDNISAIKPLVGFADRDHLPFEIKVSRSQSQQFTLPDAAPVQHFKCVEELGLVHSLLCKLPVLILRPDLHFFGSGLAHSS